MRHLVYIIIILLIASCDNYQIDMNEFHKMYGGDNEDVGALLRELSGHKIYFGHQSVGYNIMSGIERWEQETGVRIDKVETRDFTDSTNAPFVHFRVGENGDPNSKIDDFVSQVESIPGDSTSAAFFKLCYVDITGSSDVDALFEYYKEKMLYLKDNFTYCNIILVTVPMEGVQKGLRATAKKLLNRQVYGVLENIKRNEFNERLINEFSDVFPVFDLAGVETTLPDGSTETFKYKGGDYPCMPDFYRSDYGHLNDFGARIVAYNLMAFLAEELK